MLVVNLVFVAEKHNLLPYALMQLFRQRDRSCQEL